MTPLTIQQRYIIGLKALGYHPLPKRNRYSMLAGNNEGGQYSVFFVGANGALRVNKSPNAARSIPCNERFKNRVLDAAQGIFHT